MRWRRRRRSPDIIDRRGRGVGGGAPMAIPLGVGGGGLGLVVLVVFLLLNGGVLGGSGFDVDAPPRLPSGEGAQEADAPEGDTKLVDFISFVFDDVQNFWSDTFRGSGRTYERAQLVLFERATPSACGGATAGIGPHYCPSDGRVYLDLNFFRVLRTRFGAPGDFAQAYVLAHEVAHHVQDLMGITGDVETAQRRSPDQANALSIRLELQADCFAGVWAFTTYERSLLEAGDLQEGLQAAAAVGDDRIQRDATGRLDRESWTHGSSAQRVEWFRRGYENGDPNACDTFGVDVI
jgi:predicted metalloprotease